MPYINALYGRHPTVSIGRLASVTTSAQDFSGVPIFPISLSLSLSLSLS
eukprot:COSAG03_NODE_24108_length_274_cov_5.445714_1_plen_48_part_01